MRIRIRIHFGRLNPDPHWEYGSGSVSRRAKMIHKKEEILSFDVFFWGMKTSPVAWTALGIRIRIQNQEGQNDPQK
jgi:hypothetical protein